MEKRGKEKHGTEDSDDSCEEISNDKEGTGRSFDCNFCKRGFTNAQALGGHMNIHRRDKLPKSRNPSDISHKLDDLSNTSNHYFAPPLPHYQYPGSHYQRYGYYADDLGALLSLRVGSSSRIDDHGEGKEKVKNDDALDLELRLGRNP
ncbi:hypothetical protein Nepgr_021804 [Nepenthes gracilis]|uniref:C2H2-type domain-containing protein n=1 Tax=Nepenthes gracilis TaxID=150966 RepID=A0AAD3XWD9_NEPGR|nr:hypothetical protein Nepgr_021804 [Nepenthes gracilis]